ncbi:MAG: Fic family protein [Candidatus Moraniibacteriota bacterium]
MLPSSSLSDRQEFILAFAKKEKNFQTKDISPLIEERFGVLRLTVVRDLSFLEKNRVLQKTGQGRSVAYEISPRYLMLEKVDVAKYFSLPFSKRNAKPFFNDAIFSVLNETIFSKEEENNLKKINANYLQTKNELSKESPTILKREWERLIIELSWKSSEIEGNTYTLLETEALLKEMQFAQGKEKAEAQMILNHKKALDFILANKNYFKEISLEKIKQVHEMLTEKIDIQKDFRNHPVGITGTLYRPLPKRNEIEIAMRKLIDLLAGMQDPFMQAFAVLIMIAYIQPFEDGNKRTARILANAILHAHDKAMLSYRNINALEYKKAMVLFYEQNNISYIKEIFLEQFKFSVENYFG